MFNQKFIPKFRTSLVLVSSCLISMLTLAFVVQNQTFAQENKIHKSHAIAMHGKPALDKNFSHFTYVNPDAPKGGIMRYGVYGTFDSVNPFIIKGVSARGVWDFYAGRNVYESLLHRNRDEPFTLYGLLADEVTMDDERTFIEYHINSKARFIDGSPVTAEDVLHSFKLLGEFGRPNYRSLWKKVDKATILDSDRIRFDFVEGSDREAPLILSLMPVFAKKFATEANFNKSSLQPLIGTGPYKISEVVSGSKITFERRKDYWAIDLPSKRGFDNFDQLQFEYYRDQNTLFDAFKKGLFDVHKESNPRSWQKSYDFPAIKDGRLVKQEVQKQTPAIMEGFIYNTRRPNLADRRVRKALTLLFDFQWVNKNLFGGGYQRTQSFWHGSLLSAYDKKADDIEQQLLASFAESLDKDILDGSFSLPVSDGSGFDRNMLRQALTLFKEAGFTLKNRRLMDQNGNPFEFELLIGNSKIQERLALSWQQNVEKLGINMQVRIVDSAQLERRKIAFDFDVTHMRYYASFSPGAEQNGRWASSSSDIPGSFNLAGAKDKAIDAMIKELVEARTTEHFQSAVRAYDRLLMNGNYMMPLYHLDKQWFTMSRNIRRPEVTPLYGIQYPTWWDANAQ